MRSYLSLILIFNFSAAFANSWHVGYATGSYLGRSQLVGTYESEEKKSEWTLSLGFTQDNGMGPIWQYSVIYLQPIFEPRLIDAGEVLWSPFSVGAFVTYTDNTNFYVSTEDPYPQKQYYDVSSIRWGLRLSTRLENIHWYERAWQLSLEGSLLDRAFNNYFNNPEEFDIFKYYWSLGLSLKTTLD